MKSIQRGIAATLLCLGSITLVGMAGGCYPDHDHHYDQVDIVDAHGYHHQGYYDENHDWHGGYTDEHQQHHDDPHDWHQ